MNDDRGSKQPVPYNSSPPQEQSRQVPTTRDTGGGSTLTKLMVVGLVVGVGFVMLKQLPDLRRYLKMRSM